MFTGRLFLRFGAGRSDFLCTKEGGLGWRWGDLLGAPALRLRDCCHHECGDEKESVRRHRFALGTLALSSRSHSHDNIDQPQNNYHRSQKLRVLTLKISSFVGAGLCAEPDLPDILRLVLGNVRLRSGRWPVFLEGSKGGLLFCQRNGKSRLMLPGEHLTRVIIFLLVLLLARPSCGPARWHQWCCSF